MYPQEKVYRLDWSRIFKSKRQGRIGSAFFACFIIGNHKKYFIRQDLRSFQTIIISDIVKIIENFQFSLRIQFGLFSIYSGVSRLNLYGLPPWRFRPKPASDSDANPPCMPGGKVRDLERVMGPTDIQRRNTLQTIPEPISFQHLDINEYNVPYLSRAPRMASLSSGFFTKGQEARENERDGQLDHE